MFKRLADAGTPVALTIDGKPVQAQMTEGGRTYIVEGVPFNNFSGDKIGVMSIASDVTPIVEGSREALWTTAIVTVLVALLSSLGFLYVLEAFTPERKLTTGLSIAVIGTLCAWLPCNPTIRNGLLDRSVQKRSRISLSSLIFPSPYLGLHQRKWPDAAEVPFDRLISRAHVAT